MSSTTTALPTLKWAILGTGFISTQFVEDVSESRGKPDKKANHIIQAIGVSSQAKGEKFIADFVKNQSEITPKIHSYQEAINDPEVDIVYIGLPHTAHYEYTIASLNAGKHVLCEKPFTVNAKQALEVIELAKKKNLYVMEAVWTRFFPIIKEIEDHIHVKKTIGDVFRIQCDFSTDSKFAELTSDSRLKNPKFAGGALLDVGVYTLTYWRLFLDSKKGKDAVKYDLKAFQTVDNGVDAQSNTLILQKDGKQAILSNSLLCNSKEIFARIDGTKGSLFIGGERCLVSEPSYYKIEFNKSLDLPPIEKVVSKGAINGLIHEANAVAHDIAAGKTQSDIMPLDETIVVMEALDEVRRQNKLKYPGVLYDDELY